MHFQFIPVSLLSLHPLTNQMRNVITTAIQGMAEKACFCFETSIQEIIWCKAAFGTEELQMRVFQGAVAVHAAAVSSNLKYYQE